MTDLTVPDAPQLYLIAPALVSETELADRLAAVLDTHPVACLRLPPRLGLVRIQLPDAALAQRLDDWRAALSASIPEEPRDE